MLIRPTIWATLLTVLGSVQVSAQAVTIPSRLSLVDALSLARLWSPVLSQSQRTAIGADEAVRQAIAQAYTPSIGSSASFAYSGGGSTPVAGTIFQESARVSSSYNIGISMSFSGRSLMAPGEARARQELTDENIGTAAANLTTEITQQYLTVLRASAGLDVAVQSVERARVFYQLAQAKLAVGSGNGLDAKAAEVDLNSAELQVLRVRQSETEAKITLLNRIGLPVPTNLDSLTLDQATFALTEVPLDLPSLRADAHQSNPGLRVAQSQQEVSRLGVKSAKLGWLPSFSISTGLSGSSQMATNVDALLAQRYAGARGSVSGCELQNAIYSRLTSALPLPNGGIVPNCFVAAGLTDDGTALSAAAEAAVREGNSGFPFNYRRGPMGLSMGLSLPLWDQFSRSNQVSAARVAEANDRDNLRARELELDGQLQRQISSAKTLWQAISLQDLKRTNAREQLALAQARYQSGGGTALDVQTAQNTVTQAEFDYVAAVYDYHLAVVSIEALVGHPLR